MRGKGSGDMRSSGKQLLFMLTIFLMGMMLLLTTPKRKNETSVVIKSERAQIVERYLNGEGIRGDESWWYDTYALSGVHKRDVAKELGMSEEELLEKLSSFNRMIFYSPYEVR